MFAVILSTTMRCLQLGSYDKMIENVVGYFSGYMQIQTETYADKRSLEEAFFYSDSLQTSIANISEITKHTQRLESFVLSSSETKTIGALLVGIDPQMEDNVTNLSGKIIEGEYFSKPDQKSVVLAQELAKSLKLGIGDTLVVIGQGYHASSAAGKYPVSGIVKFGSPELNKKIFYLPISEAQWLFNGDIITSIVLMVENPSDMSSAKQKLESQLDKSLIVKDWKELMPSLDQAIVADNAGGLIMAGVLYIVISFGIFGTFIMMLNERQKEFGTLVSIGMKHRQLAIIVFFECVSIGVIGAFVGLMMSIPVVSWLYHNPIKFSAEAAESFESFGFEPVMIASKDPSIFVGQAELVWLLTIILSVYPIYKILKLDALLAIRK